MKVSIKGKKKKTNKQKKKTKIKVSGPVTSWQIEGEKVETVTDFLFLGFKITVDGDCSQEIKMIAPGKKSYDKPRQRINEAHTSFC